MLKEKILSSQAKIGVIGLGYVGLPLVIEFCSQNFKVIGFDIDSKKIELLKAGKSYIRHIKADKTKSLIDQAGFNPTSDFTLISEVDAIIICVPTPLDEHRDPDMKYITHTCESIMPYIRPGQLIILESTTYPGTTEDVMRPILEKSGLKAGTDFYLAFSPEREDPGNPVYTTSTIPKVVGGINETSLDMAVTLYSKIIQKVIPVSSTQAAEMTKLLENIYRSVNIALVNELKMLCDRMGIDIWEVIEAASSKPFGFHPFYPGPGLGGHCIPIDPFYLTWKAREYEFPTRFIELAGEINTKVTEFVMYKIMDALNNHSKSLKGSTILLLGVAYKKDIDDLRESPALKLIELLEDKKAHVLYNDPYIPQIPKVSPMRKYQIIMESQPLSVELFSKADAVVIVTDHSEYDYQWIVSNSHLVIDTRNATKKVTENRKKIIKA